VQREPVCRKKDGSEKGYLPFTGYLIRMTSVETAPGSTGLSRGRAFGIAVALYLVWVFAT